MGTEKDDPILSDGDLEALLSRRRLGDPRRERIITNVLAAVARREPAVVPHRTRWIWRAALTGAAASVAVLVALVRPARTPSEWRSRGSEISATSSLAVDVGCSGGTLDRCPMGSTLIIRTQLSAPVGFLVAYADPVSGDGQRIYYFSDAEAPEVRASSEPVIVDRGIRVGPEHSMGAYQIRLLIVRRRVAQAEVPKLGAADVIASRGLRLVIAP